MPVQDSAMKAREGQGTFRGNLQVQKGIRKYLSEAELDACFDLERQLRNVDRIFRRVFGEEAAGRGSGG